MKSGKFKSEKVASLTIELSNKRVVNLLVKRWYEVACPHRARRMPVGMVIVRVQGWPLSDNC